MNDEEDLKEQAGDETKGKKTDGESDESDGDSNGDDDSDDDADDDGDDMLRVLRRHKKDTKKTKEEPRRKQEEARTEEGNPQGPQGRAGGQLQAVSEIAAAAKHQSEIAHPDSQNHAPLLAAAIRAGRKLNRCGSHGILALWMLALKGVFGREAGHANEVVPEQGAGLEAGRRGGRRAECPHQALVVTRVCVDEADLEGTRWTQASCWNHVASPRPQMK